MQTRFVVILGSLMSGLGKGIITSSVLKILDMYHYNVMPIKFDGYLNFDCGTMNPYRHGEVFVLDDKGEVDMDFGMYERFLNKNLTSDHSITGGKLFSSIISKERRGDFLGEDVQMIPHMTNSIIGQIKGLAKKENLDVLVIEVGGTVGDIENGYFIEAMRQMAITEKVVFINLTYIPKIDAVGEQKTKPTQLAMRSIMQLGIKPNFLICRTSEPLEEKTISKLAMFSNLAKERIIDDSTYPTIYRVPLHFIDQHFDRLLLGDLDLANAKIDEKMLKRWKGRVAKVVSPAKRVNVAIVGKYTHLHDSYASVREALVHAGAELDTGIDINWVESTDIEKEGARKMLENAGGIIVPGGFGQRGTEGKIMAIQYARENHVPYLGLCLGMQLMTVEFARNVCGLNGANSTEFEKNARYKVIDILPSQVGVKNKGGTMRLGSWKCRITSRNSIAYDAYKSDVVYERHRHRYEFNNRYRKPMQKCGMLISGVTQDNKLVEIIEWKGQFGVATQAHPELKSRFEAPAPLFVSFVMASLAEKRPE